SSVCLSTIERSAAGSVGINPQSPNSVPEYPVSCISAKTWRCVGGGVSRSNSKAPHEHGAFAILILSIGLKLSRPFFRPTFDDNLRLCEKFNGVTTLTM